MTFLDLFPPKRYLPQNSVFLAQALLREILLILLSKRIDRAKRNRILFFQLFGQFLNFVNDFPNISNRI